jgi:hypothetical protein
MEHATLDDLMSNAGRQVDFYQEKLKYINEMRDPSTIL